ncbi:hypothetical protein PsYK624_027870 [Phanerochaete sordida]|uniref:Uncharacterized protein n=1 Tax=Phanerochaete sordida TaxID=48140 RepID=A0A9P3G1U3_9APHY|nr:hypothetical protein PsYK624_027870 [Phanerochaete sordida]
MVIRVDDTHLNYTGQWFPGGTPPQEFNGTTHGAISNGSTVSFTFNGTSIALYGTVGPIQSDTKNRTTTAVYVLDDASPVTSTAPASLTTQYGFAYYVSPPLANEQHTLVVTATDVVPDNTFWVDYVEYTPADANPSFAGPGALAAPSTSSSSGQPGAAATSAMSDFSGGHHRGSHGGGGSNSSAIVAAVLVPIIIVLLIALAGGFLWWRRRFARLNAHKDPEAKETGASVPDEPGFGDITQAQMIQPYVSPADHSSIQNSRSPNKGIEYSMTWTAVNRVPEAYDGAGRPSLAAAGHDLSLGPPPAYAGS